MTAGPCNGAHDYLPNAWGDIARVRDMTEAQCTNIDGNQDACVRVMFDENWHKWRAFADPSTEPTGPTGPAAK